MLQARITDNRTDVLKAVAALVEHSSELPCGPGLLQSIKQMISDGSYRFVVADDGHGGPLVAAGVVTFFLLPMIDNHLLAVEALWFDHELAGQLPIWQQLVDFSRQMNFEGVCLAENSTNAVGGLRELAELFAQNGSPVTVGSPLLQKQGNQSPVWSAYSEKPITSSAFFSLRTLLVHTRVVELDVSGREYTGAGPLYRGEGRLELRTQSETIWSCADLDELAAVHFARGFYARARELPAGSTEPFRGTIAEQLLHQGYVGQGAVSLSTSFEIAATYAVDVRGSERKEALVFVVDVGRLRRRTKVFDAVATLAAACPWIPTEAWAPLRRVVGALWTDLPSAGHFLERCYAESLKRAQKGAGSLVPRPDVLGYLSSEARATVEAAGVSEEELDRVHAVFEEFAEFAQQRIGAVDTLHLDDIGGYTTETQRVDPMAYFEVFARIADALVAHLGERTVLGWDTTPFGYVAKTARDDECFAAGSVPGELVAEAWVVDRAGRRVRQLPPPRTRS
jgi:hypothetical protein